MRGLLAAFATAVAGSACGLELSVADFGARVSDLLQTAAIQAAIDAVADKGGGTVRIPEGNYRTGGLVLKSGVTLWLEGGASLEASRDPEDYPSRGRRWWRGLIRADGAHDIAIVGEPHSVINGMNCYDPLGEENYRGPHGILLIGCTNVVLRGYAVRDSANWAHAIFRCGNVRLADVRVYGGHDAVDFHDSDNVTVERCELRTGDDAIAGYGNFRCTVRDCVLDTSCNAIRFGGTDCLFERCRTVASPSFSHRYSLTPEERRLGINKGKPGARSALCGFTYYCDMRWTLRHRPGNIVLRDCTFERPGTFLRMDYDGRHMWCCNRPLASIAFENCAFAALDRGAEVCGGEEDPIAVTFRNCRFAASEKGRELPVGSFYNFTSLTFASCRFEGYAEPTIITRSRGQVSIADSGGLREAYRPDPKDTVLSFAEIRASLAALSADPAAFEAWMKAVGSPDEAHWNEEQSFYMCADDPSLHDIWGSTLAVWRGDRRTDRIASRLWSMCCYFTGWDRTCAVFDRNGGCRALEAVGPYAYGLNMVDSLYARAYLTDFVRLPVKSAAAVAGVLKSLDKIEGQKEKDK